MGKGKASARLVLADAPLWSRPALRDRPAQKGAGGGRAGAIRCPGRLERRFATARPFRDDNAHGRFPARDARLVQRRPRRWERSVAVGALAALPASPCALSRSGLRLARERRPEAGHGLRLSQSPPRTPNPGAASGFPQEGEVVPIRGRGKVVKTRQVIPRKGGVGGGPTAGGPELRRGVLSVR
jgi:hypothetical protein